MLLPGVLERYSLIFQKIELKPVKLYGSFSSKRERENFLQKVEKIVLLGENKRKTQLQQTFCVSVTKSNHPPQNLPLCLEVTQIIINRALLFNSAISLPGGGRHLGNFLSHELVKIISESLKQAAIRVESVSARTAKGRTFISLWRQGRTRKPDTLRRECRPCPS